MRTLRSCLHAGVGVGWAQAGRPPARTVAATRKPVQRLGSEERGRSNWQRAAGRPACILPVCGCVRPGAAAHVPGAAHAPAGTAVGILVVSRGRAPWRRSCRG